MTRTTTHAEKIVSKITSKFDYVEGIYNNDDEKVGETSHPINLEIFPIDPQKPDYLQYAYIKMIAPVEADLGADGWMAHNQMLRKSSEVRDFLKTNEGSLSNHQSYCIGEYRYIHWMVNK